MCLGGLRASHQCVCLCVGDVSGWSKSKSSVCVGDVSVGGLTASH